MIRRDFLVNCLGMSSAIGIGGCSGVLNYRKIQKTGFNITPNIDLCAMGNLKRIGFNIFRVGFSDFSIFDRKNPKNINEAAWKKLSSIIEFSFDNNVIIVIDPHTYIGFSNKYTTHPKDIFWFNEDIQEDFRALWKKIFLRLNDLVPSGTQSNLWVDLLNEPVHFVDCNKNLSWNYLAKKIASDCYEISKNISVVVQPARLVDINGAYLPWRNSILNFEWSNDCPVIPSWHMYTPMGLSHFGVNGSDSVKNVINFPFIDDNGFVWSHDTLKLFLTDIVHCFFDSFGRAPYIGEFGASVLSLEAGDIYLRALVDLFSQLNLDWTFHAFRENLLWSPEGVIKWHECEISDSNRFNVLRRAL